MSEEEYDELAMPPNAEVPNEHALWPALDKAIREVYDPEIPVNIFELGLIYKVEITEGKDGKHDIYVEMTLTSPGCPVAQEMPGMVQSAFFPVEGVGDVDVDLAAAGDRERLNGREAQVHVAAPAPYCVGSSFMCHQSRRAYSYMSCVTNSILHSGSCGVRRYVPVLPVLYIVQ